MSMEASARQTMTKWIRRRRRAVDRLAEGAAHASVSETRRLARDAGNVGWTGEMDKLCAKEAVKQKNSFLRGLHESTVAASEANPETHQEAREYIDRLHKTAAKRVKEHKKHDERLARKGPLQMSGARVFVDPKADAKEPILKAIREGGGCLVHSRAQASMIVVTDPTSPGLRNLWAAVLNGAMLTRPARILGKQSISIKYKPATMSKRWLWVSPDFSAAFPELRHLLDQCMELPGSKWRRVNSETIFTSRAHQRIASNSKKYEYVALITKTEKKQEATQASYTRLVSGQHIQETL